MGTAMMNRPRKAITYKSDGFGINRPVRLHSPSTQIPVQREKSPSQKKAIPLFSNRVRTKAIRHRIIPRAISTMEKKRENPILEKR